MTERSVERTSVRDGDPATATPTGSTEWIIST